MTGLALVLALVLGAGAGAVIATATLRRLGLRRLRDRQHADQDLQRAATLTALALKATGGKPGKVTLPVGLLRAAPDFMVSWPATPDGKPLTVTVAVSALASAAQRKAAR